MAFQLYIPSAALPSLTPPGDWDAGGSGRKGVALCWGSELRQRKGAINPSVPSLLLGCLPWADPGHGGVGRSPGPPELRIPDLKRP